MKPTRSGEGGKGARSGRRQLVAKRTRTVRKAVLKPGEELCPVCRAGALVRNDGYLWRHRDLWGESCTNTRRARPDGAPTVDIAAALAAEEERQARLGTERRLREEREEQRARDVARQREARVDGGPRATSECKECGRVIAGERWYCGPCMAERLNARRRRPA